MAKRYCTAGEGEGVATEARKVRKGEEQEVTLGWRGAMERVEDMG